MIEPDQGPRPAGAGAIELPELRSFELRTGGLMKEDIRAICGARWPLLERLVVWFGDPYYGVNRTDVPYLATYHGNPLVRLLKAHKGTAVFQFIARHHGQISHILQTK